MDPGEGPGPAEAPNGHWCHFWLRAWPRGAFSARGPGPAGARRGPAGSRAGPRNRQSPLWPLYGTDHFGPGEGPGPAEAPRRPRKAPKRPRGAGSGQGATTGRPGVPGGGFALQPAPQGRPAALPAAWGELREGPCQGTERARRGAERGPELCKFLYCCSVERTTLALRGRGGGGGGGPTGGSDRWPQGGDQKCGPKPTVQNPLSGHGLD